MLVSGIGGEMSSSIGGGIVPSVEYSDKSIFDVVRREDDGVDV